MIKTPGTVSKILWHFTGGPARNYERSIQLSKPKDPSDAYAALKGIIKSKKVLESSYDEVVKFKNHKSEYVTKPVCCLADIPIQHLSYHQKRYGKFAIGFHRDAVLDAGFNPVIYAWHDSSLGKAVSELLKESDPETLTNLISKIEIAIKKMDNCDEQFEADYAHFDLSMTFEFLRFAINDLVANIKPLNSQKDLDSFYCEREWRKSVDYVFRLKRDEVAMIVVPEEGGFYEQFLKDHPRFPRTIPVVPWEDLIEH